MLYTLNRLCSRFRIRLFTKKQCLFTALIISGILALSILIGAVLGAIYTAAFHKNIAHSIKLAENEILGFFDSTSQMLDMLTQHPYVRAADDSIHTYTAETKKIKPSEIAKSRAEENISLLFESIYAGFSDYLEIFMGTENGGFVTSFKGEIYAGYDPRKRIWYQTGSDAQGRIALTKAFYTHNLGTAVIAMVKGFYNTENIFSGNVAISLSLKTLTAKIAKFGIGAGGAIVLMQDDGVIIADSNHQHHIFTNIIATDILQPQRFMQVTNRLQRVMFGDKHMFFQVYAFSRLPWKLIAFVDEKEFQKECAAMLHYISISGMIITLIVGLLLMVHMLRIANPQQHMVILLQVVSNTISTQNMMSFTRGDIELLPEHCDALLDEVRKEIVLVTTAPHFGI